MSRIKGHHTYPVNEKGMDVRESEYKSRVSSKTNKIIHVHSDVCSDISVKLEGVQLSLWLENHVKFAKYVRVLDSIEFYSKKKKKHLHWTDTRWIYNRECSGGVIV
ncbi:hypothetical protein Hanom_Chr16g01515771 [Helianthus anomalus]